MHGNVQYIIYKGIYFWLYGVSCFFEFINKILYNY